MLFCLVKDRNTLSQFILVMLLLSLYDCSGFTHKHVSDVNASSPSGYGELFSNHNEHKIAIVTYVQTHEQIRSVKSLIKSIRHFGGKYSESPIYVILGDPENFIGQKLKGENVVLLPLEMDDSFKSYPLAIKAFAMAQVERRVKNKSVSLVWFDPGTLVLNMKSLEELDLDGRYGVAIRPVSLTNSIGLTPGTAPNAFWKPIYQACGLDYQKLPSVTTVVDEVDIQPYYNCEIFSINPKLGIAEAWAELLSKLLKDDAYQRDACTSFVRRLFLHQAVLSGVITSRVEHSKIKDVPIRNSYPFNQHRQLVREKQIASLNELNAVIFDQAWNRSSTWMNRIPAEDPLRAWLMDTYLEYSQLADRLYRLEGSCNSYLVVTDEGSVLIDPAGASGAPEYYKRILKNHPLKAILLTHAHQDHSDDIAKWKGGLDIPVIVQRKFVEYFEYQARLAGHFSRRNAIWSGQPIPPKPEPKVNSQDEATILFADSYDFELGGIHFHMIHTPGETPDHTTIWIPELEAVCVGDNYYEYFINNTTFRGTMIRPVLGYIAALDTALSFNPRYFLTGHSPPVLGRERIQKTVGDFRDALKYIHDETIKGINEGKDVYTLMQQIQVPSKYNIVQGFGKVAWTVRGIYQENIGWFDGNPANMYPLPPSSVYVDLVQLAGGPDSILKRAEKYYQNAEFNRVLHLTDVVLESDPDNESIWKIRMKSLEALKRGPYNYIERIFLDHEIRSAKKKIGQ